MTPSWLFIRRENLLALPAAAPSTGATRWSKWRHPNATPHWPQETQWNTWENLSENTCKYWRIWLHPLLIDWSVGVTHCLSDGPTKFNSLQRDKRYFVLALPQLGSSILRSQDPLCHPCILATPVAMGALENDTHAVWATKYSIRPTSQKSKDINWYKDETRIILAFFSCLSWSSQAFLFLLGNCVAAPRANRGSVV